MAGSGCNACQRCGLNPTAQSFRNATLLGRGVKNKKNSVLWFLKKRLPLRSLQVPGFKNYRLKKNEVFTTDFNVLSKLENLYKIYNFFIS